MSPERSGKGLWERVKEALGVTGDDEDLAAAPQVTSTFTAHRFPSGGPLLPGPLFPPGDDREGKWELYEDGWKQTEVPRHEEPRPARDRDGWERPAGPRDEPEVRPPDDAPGTPTRAPGLRSDDEPGELSATLQSLVTDGDSTGLLDHVDDEEADALAQAFGLDELPPRRQEPRDEAGPAPPPVGPDTGTERQVEVHEDRVAQANARSRRAPRPGVNVHDAHLERSAGPVTLTPSEAMALAERGRDAIGPRKDVGPAG